MSNPKSTGKLKYDLALSTSTVYDTSSLYVNKSAEISLNGNSNLQYKTIGPTYLNQHLWDMNAQVNATPGPSGGKAYLYIRNLGPTNGAVVRISTTTDTSVTDTVGPTGAPGPDGVPDQYDKNQFSELNVGEFAYFPLCLSQVQIEGPNIFVRSGFVAGSTYWTGATNNQIEYMMVYALPNMGPKF